MEDMDLDKIDAIIERTGASYHEAQRALEIADGDVLDALVALERGHDRKEKLTKTFTVKGGELLREVKKLVREGNVRSVVIRKDDRTLLRIPMTLGAVGALLWPYLTATAAVAAMVSECTIYVQRREDARQEEVRTE